MKKVTEMVKKHPYYTVLAVITVLLVSMAILRTEKEAPTEAIMNVRSVETLSVTDYNKGALGIVAPTAGGDSFVVRAESSGRVESVNVKNGDTVKKGVIIARLDNESQRASLVQAQGVYEAAQASAEQSNFSVDSQTEALTSSYTTANSTLRSSAISIQGVLSNNIDFYFTSANRASFELSDYSWEKKLLEYAISDWNEATKTPIPNDQVVSELDKVIAITERVSDLLDVIYRNVIEQEDVASASYLTTLNSYKTSLTAAKTTVATTLQTLKSTRLNVIDAKSSLERTQSSSIGGDKSAVEAQVKQALGAYQSAQAAYNKTLVKAPFDGTITTVNVAVGDIINFGTDIAIIKPVAGVDTTKSFDLPIAAIKYTPENAYVFSLSEDGTLKAIPIKTGLVTADYINVTGLAGDEVIVKDVRGLKAGEQVQVSK